VTLAAQFQDIYNQLKLHEYIEYCLPVLSLNSAGLGGGVFDTLGDMSSVTKTTTSVCFKCMDTWNKNVQHC